MFYLSISLDASMEHLNCDIQTIQPTSGEAAECAFCACSLFEPALKLFMSVDQLDPLTFMK